ncbi:MAG: L,D-transpeptidase [Acidimicrobiia bacterium]|nr:L,D-transpeptidase [Acidimicrobiia bacterium]
MGGAGRGRLRRWVAAAAAVSSALVGIGATPAHADDGDVTAVALAPPAPGSEPEAAVGLATAPPAPTDPFGYLDAAHPAGEGIRVAGWVIDPDTSSPAQIVVQVDTNWYGPFAADRTRGDVERVHPGWGSRHGYDLVVPAAPGPRSVCVHALNVGPGANVVQGCASFTVDDPIGWIDSMLRTPDGIRVAGWALDEDARGPSDIVVQVADRWLGPFRAELPRGDVAGLFPWAGDRHGFDLTVPLPAEGNQPVCVHALGVGPGAASTLVGCRYVVVSHAPFGYLDTAGVNSSDMRIAGWAADPDTSAPTEIVVQIGDAWYGPYRADAERPDVAAAFPGIGANHGFDLRFPMPARNERVCVYAQNLGEGSAPLLMDCRRMVAVPAGSGEGRRIVYDNLGQRLWLIGSDGYTARSYAISGRYLDPAPGTQHRVYGKFRYAEAGHDDITMQYFVAFNPSGLGYGFHTIPVWGDGSPLQSESELGQFRSAGCVRQALVDAVYMWNWSQIGDLVVVV